MQTILYHANCNDGFGAAWAAWLALGDNAQYIPVRHNEHRALNLEGSVAILDFSIDRQTLEAWRKDREVIVIDHHITAAEALKGVDGCIFDMDKSGAMLAWEYYHPGIEPPQLIRYLQDHDLYKFELPESRWIRSFISATPYEFDLWSNMNALLEQEFGRVLYVTAHLDTQTRTAVNKLCQNTMFAQIGPHIVPCVNSANYFSELGERLLELHPTVPFVVVWFRRNSGVYQYSLRSNGFDVSAIAKLYGGGGHKCAAGFVSNDVPSLRN